MNGVHDMGGMHGFGPVDPEPGEPPFHERWEGRCLALNRAMGVGGVWNIDRSRAAIEELPPHVYLRMSYYERWAMRLQNLLLECGLVDGDEIRAGHAFRPGRRGVQPLSPADVDRALVRGRYDRHAPTAPRFATGERVRTRNMHPVRHTRLPRYARGHVGVVEHVRGCHVFPDSAASSGDENPQWLYTVVFEGRELWGDDCDPKLKVSIEAFEPYLEPT